MFKQQAQNLLHLIDKHGNRPLRLHIWSDDVTLNREPIIDGESKGGSDPSGKKKKGRNRSNSNASDTPKKAHPRSKEAASPMQQEDQDQAPMSCLSHFFTGKCSGGVPKKGGLGCQYEHYFEPLKPLSGVVTDKSELIEAQEAAASAIPGETSEYSSNSMDLLNYTQISVELSENLHGDEVVSISDDIIQQLSRNDTNLANLVYVVAGEKIIFDRHRDGICMNERDILLALGGHDQLGRRRISVGSESEAHGRLHKLPGSILEHTLLFLPDAAVAACSAVCKDWNSEIGKASPNLWRLLLQRRNWPLPLGDDQRQATVRKTFIQHYTAMRDVEALRSAMVALTTRKSQSEEEMCYLDFASRKTFPAEDNHCAAIQVWSENRVLLAYRSDCSLRLFEASPKASNEKACKELVYQRLDPYKNTKRLSCSLLDMDVDAEYIGSLCRIEKANMKPKHLLIVVTREEFLLGDSSTLLEKGAHPEEMDLITVDIEEAMVNYVLSSDVADHRQLQLFDFLHDGGEIEDIEVLSSGQVVACGGGRFLLDVTVAIPPDDVAAEEGEEESTVLIDRKFVLLSASAGAILWICDSYDTASPLPPPNDYRALAGCRAFLPGDYQPSCQFVLSSTLSPDLFVGIVNSSGECAVPSTMQGSYAHQGEGSDSPWVAVNEPIRHIQQLASNCVIDTVVYRKDLGNEGLFDTKCLVKFFSLHRGESGAAVHCMEFPRLCIVQTALLGGGNYLLLVGREYSDFIEVADVEGNVQLRMGPESACFIAVHIPTRQVIYRTGAGVDCFPSYGPEKNTSVPLIASNSTTSTIGLALNWSGVAITGDDVRHIEVSNFKEDQPLKETKKKKKASKAGNAKGRKKDGFARGMSSRG